MSMKNSNDTTGNRTRDLPACSAVPQPTAPPRAPKLRCMEIYKQSRNMQAIHNSQRHRFISMHEMKYPAATEACFASPVEVSVIRL
jgi:hypothetical protein